MADLDVENVLHKKYVRGKEEHDFVTNSMLWKLSQRIFSVEKLCCADLVPNNVIRMLIRGAKKGKIPSQFLHRKKYPGILSSEC